MTRENQLFARAHTCPFDGRTMLASQWAEVLGLHVRSFRQRLERWGADNPRTWGINAEGNEEFQKLSDHMTAEKRARLRTIPQPGTWEVAQRRCF